MSIVNFKVMHENFGVGIIIKKDNNRVTVKFKNESKKFQYPSCFMGGYLKLLNEEEAQKIKMDINKLEIDEKNKIKEKKKSLETKTENKQESVHKKKIDKNSKLVEAHSEIFKFLCEYKKEHSGFYFIPRRKGGEKLEEGLLFIGDYTKYLMVGFSNTCDTKEKTHNYGMEYYPDNNIAIKLSSRDDDNKAKYMRELVQLLKYEYNLEFKEEKQNVWYYRYPHKADYFSVIKTFIVNHKPIIDKFFIENKEAKVDLADVSTDKYIEKILANNKNRNQLYKSINVE